MTGTDRPTLIPAVEAATAPALAAGNSPGNQAFFNAQRQLDSRIGQTAYITETDTDASPSVHQNHFPTAINERTIGVVFSRNEATS